MGTSELKVKRLLGYICDHELYDSRVFKDILKRERGKYSYFNKKTATFLLALIPSSHYQAITRGSSFTHPLI